MTRFARLEVLTAMVETGLAPVFGNGDLQASKNIVEQICHAASGAVPNCGKW